MSTQEKAIHSGPDQDLENARALLEDSPWKDSPHKYRKAARHILQRVLMVDPENARASALLLKANEPAPQPAPAPPAPAAPAPAPPSRLQSEAAFVVDTLQIKREKPRGKTPVLPITLAAFLVGAGIMAATKASTPKAQFPVTAPATSVAPASPVLDPPAPDPVAESPEPPPAPAAEIVTAAAPDPPPQPIIAAIPAAVVKTPAPVVAQIQTGTLALSSPTTVDIYMGDRYVGSLPTTLELPAGNQTLEYRHQDQRKLVTHVVKPNETTPVMVTFDVSVQINARPWAQVFIGGTQKQALGQTPLSDVHVPIGSVLVFENPNFAAKNYRVTGKESEIRINFP